MRVVGVDPGQTTGVSIIEDGKPIWEAETTSLQGLYGILEQWASFGATLVVERFILSFRYQSRNAEAPYKAIGVCELFSEKWNAPMVLSNPAVLQSKKKAKPRGLSPHLWSARCHAMNYWEHHRAGTAIEKQD